MDRFRSREIYADGEIVDLAERGNRLYVNRGIGFSSISVRINCRPELTMLTLRRGEIGRK